MRLNKAIINGSLVLLLALGLGGCANNNASTHKASHEPASAKITKPSSHKKDNDSRNKQAVAKPENSDRHNKQAVVKQENNTDTTTPVTANTVTSYTGQPVDSATSPVNAGSYNATTNKQFVAGPTTVNTATNQVTPPVTPGSQQATTTDEQECPAAFYYNWVWTDAQGRTHNVNWDLMDRINDNGQITYADYYDELPSNAVQYDQRDFNLHYDGTDQWIINFDNQINATPNHGVVNRN